MAYIATEQDACQLADEVPRHPFDIEELWLPGWQPG